MVKILFYALWEPNIPPPLHIPNLEVDSFHVYEDRYHENHFFDLRKIQISREVLQTWEK